MNYIKDQRNKSGEIKTAFIDGQLDAKKKLLPIIEEKEKLIEVERIQKEEANRKLALKMKKYGEPIEEIMKETGLSAKEIDNL